VAARVISKQTARRPSPRAHGVTLDVGAIREIEIYITNARVSLASGESMFLSEESQGWRLSALGCQPQGKPTNEPFDCELEA
jgi:hypothetical protein